MINLRKIANEQNGIITIEQLDEFFKDLEDMVESDKPEWYGDGRYHSTTIYEGEDYLLQRILKANEVAIK